MALILNFIAKKFKMLIAAKDDLKIQVTVLDQKVNITMPEMEDVIVLWTAWIKQEEKLAELFLKSQYLRNPYPVLRRYFQEKGWATEHFEHSQ
jgi:hypothetical protein